LLDRIISFANFSRSSHRSLARLLLAVRRVLDLAVVPRGRPDGPTAVRKMMRQRRSQTRRNRRLAIGQTDDLQSRA
jgi:hypothetical protein